MERKLIINTAAICANCPTLIGFGGIIFDELNNRILYSFSISKNTGTISEGHYLAIIEALQWVIQSGISVDTVLLNSDSHLVICQLVRGVYPEGEDLTPIRLYLQELIKQLNCKVDYVWIPEEKNAAACALACSAAGMPCGFLDGDCVTVWTKEHSLCPNEELVKCLPEINEETQFQIDLLNNSAVRNISSVFSLLSFGMDKYSRSKVADLFSIIDIRFGPQTSDFLLKTLRDINSYYSKNALRWIARGLRPDLAFLKARIENEIKEESVR